MPLDEPDPMSEAVRRAAAAVRRNVLTLPAEEASLMVAALDARRRQDPAFDRRCSAAIEQHRELAYLDELLSRTPDRDDDGEAGAILPPGEGPWGGAAA